ncbi:MAG: LPS assembly protein LptD, partial [Epsilonproteobacteria bacterium]|nr:LPS assembly protein LptD [Campylobacterota bacterium]
FKDTTKDDNDETIQIAPKLHFHMPLQNLIYNNFSYSFDTSLTNYTRDSGTKALKIKSKLPLNMHFSLFGGFLNLNISPELDMTGYDFYNVPIDQKKYSSIVANSNIELSSELVKKYESGLHIAFFSAAFTKSTILSEEWMEYEEIPEDLKINFVDDIPFESKITFRTHQYWNSKDLNINYILESHYYPSENKFRDLDQEIDLKYKNFSFYSKIGYSFIHKQTTDIYNTIGFNTNKYGFSLGYLWKKDYLSLETISKELSWKGYYNYSSDLKFNGKVAYDLKEKGLKNWESGIFYRRKCWSINFAVGQNITPVIKEDGDRGSIKNNYVKLYLTILPFGFGIKNNGD